MNDLDIKILKKIDLMRDDIIKFHQDIIRIPSENPPGNYKEIAKFVENKIKEIGLKTINKRNNIIGEFKYPNEGPALILYGHMDTVEAFKGWSVDPFGGEVIGNRIYGRGACDDKACVTSQIFAAKVLIESNIELKGSIKLASVIDEEMGGLKGAGFLLNKGYLSGDACLLGDGPGGYPGAYFGGALFPSFLIKGKSAHGMSFPDLKKYRNENSGINAINKMLKILNFLNDLQEEFYELETKYSNFPGFPSKISQVNLGKIQGGSKISIVADNCLLHCSINTIPEQDIASIEKRIYDFIEKYKEEDPNLNINVTIPIKFEPQIMDIKSDFAQAVQKAFSQVYGELKDFRLFISTTDAHFFQEHGIETILAGSGGANNNTHAPDEFIEIDDLINTTKIFALTALNYLKKS